MTITCLSVRQPYASLIVYGPKWPENRSWATPHRGPLWVHASGWDAGWDRPPASDPLAYGFPVPTGVLLGCADLLGCWDADAVDGCRDGTMPAERALWESLRRLARDPRNFFGWDYVAGPVCWLLADRRPLLEPIPMPGRLRLWTADVPAGRLRLADPTPNA